MTILTFIDPCDLDLQPSWKMFQMALLLLEDNNCANLFWNPCMNVQVMARSSSIYDHFDLHLTPVTLTFNIPKKLFQMALLLLEGSNCAKLSQNLCINVQVMARTSSIHVYDHFDLYWPLWLRPSTYLKKRFQMALLLLKGNNCAKLFWNPCIIENVMVRTNPDGCTDAHTYTEQKL